MTIIVAPYSRVLSLLISRRPSHVLTLLSPETEPPACPGILPERHLKLSFHDVAMPMEGLVAPDRGIIDEILEFEKSWNAAAPILVHCWAGISRSTAAAFILACRRAGPGREHAIAQSLRNASPSATPNSLMVRLADEALGRDGAMIAAATAIGRGSDALEGVPFEVALT